MNILPWKGSRVSSQQGRRQSPASLMSLQEEINELFDSFWSHSRMPSLFSDENTGDMGMPAVDVIENTNHYKVKAELPGIEEKDVEVTTGEGYLTIRGTHQNETEEKDENYLRHETSYGSFQRTVSLPETADLENADARFKNGLLTISIPKKAEALKKEKRIRIQGAA